MTIVQRLATTLTQTEAEITEMWPEIVEYISKQSQVDSTKQNASSPTKTITDQTTISIEEHRSLCQQLQSISALPPGHFDPPIAQELAMKLSYSLQRSISFSQEAHQLSYAHGGIRALLRVASPDRSAWIPPRSDVNQEQSSTDSENWSVSISPRDLTLEVRTSEKQPWFLHQRVLVINPRTLRAVVGHITDILTESLNRYQFGGAPALIRAGGFWTPASRGQAIVCFLGDAVTLGTVFDLQSLQ